MSEFKDKVVVVSGSASGIGAASSKLYAGLGAYVIGVDLAPSSETSQAIYQQGGKFEFIEGDVSLETTWQHTARLADQRGGADVLVNIAGISVIEDNVETMTSELFDKIIGINLKGTWLGINHLIGGMKKKGGGAIVNMSSATSLIGVPNHAAYSMSKGGVDAMTRQVAVDYAKDNIRVNAVCPGPVRTPLVATNTEEKMREIVEAVPLKRMAEPEEVAEAVRFLSSKAASSITGTVLPIEGGMTIAM